MGKLIVPRANEREKSSFEQLNIKLIDTIDEKKFKEVVIEYLNQHNVLHLATCRDNEPRSTPLEYFNNGLTVYVLSEGGGKFANLKINPKVSFSISDPYEPIEDFIGFTGLQVWGIASTFKKNTDLKRFEEILKYRRNLDELKKQGRETMGSELNFNVIIIEPLKVRYLNLKKGFRNVSWEAGK